MNSRNPEKPLPSASITMRGPVDGKRDPYFYPFDFDLADPAAYTVLAAQYQAAWEAYYNVSVVPSYTPENAIKLRDAVKFWFYMDDGSTETANVEAYDSGLDNYDDGIIDKPEAIRTSSPGYPQDYYGTRTDPEAVSRWEVAYDDPNALYDQGVYNTVTSNGANPIPEKVASGDRVIKESRAEGNNAQVYSAKQREMQEWETTRTAPESSYDWGGAYAGTGRTY